MRAVKSVKQPHNCADLDNLIEEFRFMVNETIRVGIEKKITSKLRMRNELYPKFKNYFHTIYINMAVFMAHALKAHRKALKKNPNARKPYVWKKFLIVDSYKYRIFYDHIQIPTGPREFVVITLNQYVFSTLSDPTLKHGNVTITTNHLIISGEQAQGVRYVRVESSKRTETCLAPDAVYTLTV